MSLAAFNVTVPLDGAVILPPEFAGQEIRIVIETPLTEREKQDRLWESVGRIAHRVQSRWEQAGIEPPSEEEVMSHIKADRQTERDMLPHTEKEIV